MKRTLLINLVSSISLIFIGSVLAPSVSADSPIHTGKNDVVEIKQALKIVSKNNVYFAHKSVGNNIITGIEEIAQQYSIDIDIVKTDSRTKLNSQHAFYHSMGGYNKDPISKIDDFVSQIKANAHINQTQIAFMKFCYLDFAPEANVNQIFEYYKNELHKLEVSFPDITFLHLSVPLTGDGKGFKKAVKRFFGMTTWEQESNIVRERFSTLLREYYSADSLFDLAKIESTYFDGSRSTFTKDGKYHYNLVEDFTSNGGHLNSVGRKHVATQFVMFLSKQLSINDFKQ